MADGNVGRANAGCYKQVERQPRGAQASLAHCDFKKPDSSGGDTRRRPSHGEVLAAKFLPGLEENGLGWSYKGFEHVVRGLGGS